MLAIIETVSRVVDRIGPIQFEPMEKHPPSNSASSSTAPSSQGAPAREAPPGRAADDHTPAMTVDPPAEYEAKEAKKEAKKDAKNTPLDAPFNDDDGNGVDDGLEP